MSHVSYIIPRSAPIRHNSIKLLKNKLPRFEVKDLWKDCLVNCTVLSKVAVNFPVFPEVRNILRFRFAFKVIKGSE